MCRIAKRDGRIVEFKNEKIRDAILKAFKEVDEKPTVEDTSIAIVIADDIEELSKEKKSNDEILTVEEIQDIVENKLMNTTRQDVAKAYIRYRYKRNMARTNTMDKDIKELIAGENEYLNSENSNKNSQEVTVLRDYLAGIACTDAAKRYLLPDDIVKAHNEGIIHFHDMDYSPLMPLHNCCLINLNDMLQNGTVINKVMIEKPHRFKTAANIATQIILGVSSSQYGGASITTAHLAPFVRDSYDRYIQETIEEFKLIDKEYTNEEIEIIAKKRLKKEVEEGVQIINYQLNSMHNTNGQAPFLTIYMDVNENPEYVKENAMIIEEILKQRLQGFKNEKGVWVTPAWPKLIYCLDENNIKEDGEFWYLTVLSAQCNAKRMVPDYISAKVMRQLKGDIYPCMGCRSFLTPDRFTDVGIGNIAKAKDYEEGKHKYYGRFNQGVVTINLPNVALASKKDETEFWKILDERLELCHKALKCRHNRLKGVVSDVAPLLWQYGALARLEKGETIEKLLYDGYSTISVGIAGLYEMVYYMKDQPHTTEEGRKFALAVLERINDKAKEWKKEENIDYSVYGTPIETLTYKFAKINQEQYGIIPEVTDHLYITNSYHINVRENIDAFEKITKEAEFQALCPGGAISYVEVPNLQNNIPAVLSLIKHIYNSILYAELNTKSDYCMECGYSGEIVIKGEKGHPYWECPQCGNRDQNKMSVVRRTCGQNWDIRPL